MPHDRTLNHSHVSDFFQRDGFFNTNKDAFLHFERLGSQDAFHAGKVAAREELPQGYPKQQQGNADDADRKGNGSRKQPVGADFCVEFSLSNDAGGFV
jgi:hypothetical protein